MPTARRMYTPQHVGLCSGGSAVVEYAAGSFGCNQQSSDSLCFNGADWQLTLTSHRLQNSNNGVKRNSGEANCIETFNLNYFGRAACTTCASYAAGQSEGAQLRPQTQNLHRDIHLAARVTQARSGQFACQSRLIPPPLNYHLSAAPQHVPAAVQAGPRAYPIPRLPSCGPYTMQATK